MGVKAWFLQLANIIKREDNHQVQASSFASDIYDSTILHHVGVVSGVPHKTKVIAVKLGHTRNQIYLLPYAIDALQPIESGSLMLYATEADGKNITGNIILSHDGKVTIATQQDDLLAIIKDTLALLQSLQTFGSPASHTPLPDWVASAKQLESRLDAMAKYQ